jgi:AraC-like DNA-binding protein
VEAGTGSRVLPDGSVDIVWDDGAELFVAGPDTGPVLRELRPGSTIVGLRFRPGVAGVGLGLPASELRDAHVTLEDVWDAPAGELAETLVGAAGAGQKRRLLEEAVIRRLPGIDAPDPLILGAIRQLGRPASRVGALSDSLFVSERHLRRIFREAIGYGPKTLDRVLRFRRFISLGAAIARGEEQLAGVAAQLGYSDQAHLSREIASLSGLSPRRLVETWHP